MKYLAIVDIPKSGGSPVLQLPEDAVTVKEGSLWKISFQDRQAFFYVLKNTPTRWIAFVAAPKKAFNWLENKLGADVYNLTASLITNQRAALENLGLTFDVNGRMLSPHVICGQNPWIEPEAI